MKTPFQQAAEAFLAEPHARSLTEDLEAHLINGFVFSRPDYFVMGRPVIRTAPEAQIVDPWHRFPSGQCDCWHVYLMAGNMAKAWEILPWAMPWMSFERKNELRFVPLEAMKRLALPSPCATNPASLVSFSASRTP